MSETPLFSTPTEKKRSGSMLASSGAVREGRRLGHQEGGEASLLRDNRGAVLTEYIVLVGAVGLIVAFAVSVAGVDLIRRFETARLLLLMPVP